jgi:tetratricopeptide (TPR) repeat protein
MMGNGWARIAVYLLPLLVVFAIYWPVRHAQFVWDDLIIFHDAAWLRHGDSWLKFLKNGLSGYINYFRPLIVALDALQLRLFQTQPGPMHLVSLALHLCNVALVGVFAQRLCAPERPSPLIVALCMLIYGMHPALVESVVWIECQNELVVTLFILLALIANSTIVGNGRRAFTVGICFFVAACAKESAAVLPLLIVICDLSRRVRTNRLSLSAAMRNALREQRSVYLGLLIAGTAYLAFRAWGLGFVIAPSGSMGLFAAARWQKVCFTLLNYVRIAVWPMAESAPLHEVDENLFAGFSLPMLTEDLAAVALMVAGIALFFRRRTLGALIVSFTVALIAVLNIIPVRFVESVYHERYLTLALAVSCAWLAVVLTDSPIRRTAYRYATALVAVAWIAAATTNVRATIPLWADESSLWHWAARGNPESLVVRDHLLSLYVSDEDYPRAYELAQQLVAENVPCPSCNLNAAFLALQLGDEKLAATALGHLEKDPALAYSAPLLHQYILATGELREVRKDLAGAEDAYRDAMSTDPDDPAPPMQLAALLISQGRSTEGRKLGQLAIELYAPDERQRRQAVLDAIANAAK